MNTSTVVASLSLGAFMAGCLWYGISHGPRYEQKPPKPHDWKWLAKCQAKWHNIQSVVHHHPKAFHRVHEGTHLGYFALVFLQGPYNVAAGALIVLIVLGWALKLEDL